MIARFCSTVTAPSVNGRTVLLFAAQWFDRLATGVLT